MISPPQLLLHIQTHKKWIKNKQTISERQDELLVIAEQLVTEQGFANFTMDKLTAHSSYSKGTIYNHFNSKEGLIAALSIKSLTIELGLFTASLSTIVQRPLLT
jgi:AcrR family transcriptional regulator